MTTNPNALPPHPTALAPNRLRVPLNYVLCVIFGVLIANPAILGVVLGDARGFLAGEERSLARLTQINSNERSSAVIVVWGSIYLYTAFRLLIIRQAIARIIRATPLSLVLFLLVTAASAAWSLNSGTSIQRFIHLFGKTLVAGYVAIYVGRLGIERYFFHVLAIVVGVGALAAILWPEVGQFGYRGESAWRGFFTHKSAFGHSSALLFIIALSLHMRKNHKKRHRTLLVLAMSLVCLALSQSITSWIAAVIGIGTFALVRNLTSSQPSKLKIVVLFLSISTITLICFASIFAIEYIVVSLGRDITLSGRTVIWIMLAPVIEERLWLGYGYSAVWNSDYVYPVFFALNRWVANAHSAFVQCALETGLIGLIFFLLTIFTLFRRGMTSIAQKREQLGSIYLTVTTMLVFIGILESSLYSSQQINWFLMCAFIFSANISNRRGVDHDT